MVLAPDIARHAKQKGSTRVPEYSLTFFHRVQLFVVATDRVAILTPPFAGAERKHTLLRRAAAASLR